jgi:hypothetical protein
MAAISLEPGEIRSGEFIKKETSVWTIEAPKPKETEKES